MQAGRTERRAVAAHSTTDAADPYALSGIIRWASPVRDRLPVRGDERGGVGVGER